MLFGNCCGSFCGVKSKKRNSTRNFRKISIDEDEIFFDCLSEGQKPPHEKRQTFKFLSNLPKTHPDLDFGFGMGTVPKFKLNLPSLNSLKNKRQSSADDLPMTSWSAGEGSAFKVRCGPNYRKKALKDFSRGHLYECVGCDLVKSERKIITHGVHELLNGVLPGDNRNRFFDLMKSTPTDLKIPRVLVINVKLPFQTGPKLFGSHPSNDFGCSILIYFVVTEETLNKIGEFLDNSKTKQKPPEILSLSRFYRTGRTDNFIEGVNPTFTDNLLKIMCLIDNLDELDLSSFIYSTVNSYNGKPVLITRSGTVFHNDEYLEISFDVRKFAWMARSMLTGMRSTLKKAHVHLGFTIQEVEDENLPEVVLCAVRLHNVDIENSENCNCDEEN